MSFEDHMVQYKKVGGHLFASVRRNVQNREGIAELVQVLKQAVPPGQITGPAIVIRYFIHSYPDGLDLEVGFPVRQAVETDQVTNRHLPEAGVLAKEHTNGIGTLGEAYGAVFGSQSQYGLISDEFCFEVLHDEDPSDGKIEVQMVLHDWQALFGQHLNRVMGQVVQDAVMEESDTIFLDTSVNERFEWVKAAVDRFDLVSDDYQRYEVISSCSHVFPRSQADKLRVVYQQAYQEEPGMHTAVDAVLEFIDEDPGWAPGQRVREGDIVYITKRPSNPEAYAKATTDLERKQAYCFCPIVKANIDKGMSPSFCYCSAGFERKQWEVALGQPVRIDVVKSLLKGNMQCQFAVHLPD